MRTVTADQSEPPEMRQKGNTMANWKCSKCGVEMEETKEIKLIFNDLDLPPARGYKCPSCGVEYLDGDYVTEELGSVEEMLEGK
jgi:DNA-directed RNA polymerase subunit RPC12/RpoP